MFKMVISGEVEWAMIAGIGQGSNIFGLIFSASNCNNTSSYVMTTEAIEIIRDLVKLKNLRPVIALCSCCT